MPAMDDEVRIRSGEMIDAIQMAYASTCADSRIPGRDHSPPCRLRKQEVHTLLRKLQMMVAAQHKQGSKISGIAEEIGGGLKARPGYLAEAPSSAAVAPVVGEALLSLGRFMPPGDMAPIVRWTTATDVELRWRAAWALFRPRDPAAVPHLLKLTNDASGEVRFWAVRGLAPAIVDQSGTSREVTSARLREAVMDSDRRVRTEALRALTAYDDDESFAVVAASLDSPDTWLSVSAAEALGRFKSRKDMVVPKLVAAMAPARPLSLRITALTPLAALSPNGGLTSLGGRIGAAHWTAV